MNLLHYGLQRSGTNFLEAIIKKKYRVKFLNSNKDRSSPLQKHFRLYDEKKIIPEPQYRNEFKVSNLSDFEHLLDIVPDYYLVISKDPYSWLLSYKNWGEQCNWPDISHHYIIEYNLFYEKWLEFSQQSERVIFIRYADLLRNTSKELSRLEMKMCLKKKLLHRFTPSLVKKVSQSGQFSSERGTYYLRKQYLKSYTAEGFKEINSFIDPNVISLLGYQKEGNYITTKA